MQVVFSGDFIIKMPMLTASSTIVSSPLLPTAAPRKLSEKIICRAGYLQSTEGVSNGKAASKPSIDNNKNELLTLNPLISEYVVESIGCFVEVKISIKEKKSHEEIAKQNLPN
ncbi:hypothetical protein Prudu_007452 [Prunus dulcis]|uniref:Uncharacterized protein n=1 Tax=Prunus dulcis TaxID=3755 RepID=A0A4Y1R242_PRUDU|nr:hypothetical protein Prudu_007452 [Prunus dulcis]